MLGSVRLGGSTDRVLDNPSVVIRVRLWFRILVIDDIGNRNQTQTQTQTQVPRRLTGFAEAFPAFVSIHVRLAIFAEQAGLAHAPVM